MKKRNMSFAAAALAAGLVLTVSTPASAATASYGAISCGAGWAGVQVTGYGTLTAVGLVGPTSYSKSWTVPAGQFQSHRYSPVHSLTSTTGYASGGFVTGWGNGKGCWSTKVSD